MKPIACRPRWPQRSIRSSRCGLVRFLAALGLAVLVAAAGRHAAPARLNSPLGVHQGSDLDRWEELPQLPGCGLSSLTLLDGGRALAVTHTYYCTPDQAAAVFDPRLHAWSPVATLIGNRTNHAATRLTDGRVLISGGCSQCPDRVLRRNPTRNPNSPDNRLAELHDPTTGRFQFTGALPEGLRFGHTGALLPDGRVLVAGGCQDLDICHCTSEIYGPATGQSTPAAPLSVPRFRPASTTLLDGRILVIGGSKTFDNVPETIRGQASAEIFDPSTGRWTLTAAPNEPRVVGAAVTLRDGRVLAVGLQTEGLPGLTHSRWNAEIYDPAQDRWQPTAPLAGPVNYDCAAVLLPSGRVLVVGGSWTPSSEVPEGVVQLYNQATDTWTLGPTLRPTNLPAVARLPDGRVLVVAGTKSYLSDPSTDRWLPAAELNHARCGHLAIRLADGRVLALGGVQDDILWDAEVYDPAANRWTLVELATLDQDRPWVWLHRGATAVLLPDGQVLIAGMLRRGPCGVGRDGRWTRILDPTTWQVAAGPDVTTELCFPLSTLLPDGSVLLLGGERMEWFQYQRDYGEFEWSCFIDRIYPGHVQRFDPTRGVIELVGQLAAPACGLGGWPHVTPLPDSRLLLALRASTSAPPPSWRSRRSTIQPPTPSSGSLLAPAPDLARS